MIVDKRTQQLFSQFPREVGFPGRYKVYDQNEFIKFLLYAEGTHDCYTAVYPESGIIDKIFFDFDGYARALEDAKAMYRYLKKQGHIVVPVASGKKGIHLYVILDHIKYDDPKSLLLNAHYSILYGTFGDTGYTQTTADPRIFGDTKRITRIQNTRRPPDNNSYCVWLPDDDFLDMSWLDVIMWCKEPHYMQAVPFSSKTLYDFAKVDVKRLAMIEHFTDDYAPVVVSSDVVFFLKEYLRPCL
jgi:hypothetical protein